ncbi:hypothetical protein C8R46DRAFT_1140755 [Mycena filopes]|nr:hypothetical protein C8R46DRAFT_1140755 [Mycena filopes]
MRFVMGFCMCFCRMCWGRGWKGRASTSEPSLRLQRALVDFGIAPSREELFCFDPFRVVCLIRSCVLHTHRPRLLSAALLLTPCSPSTSHDTPVPK